MYEPKYLSRKLKIKHFISFDFVAIENAYK